VRREEHYLDSPEIKAALARQGDFWVFGYGSLMWDPGFRHAEVHPALLYGYHRRFCVYSYRYRGTPECPGLVLGLDHGGACRGMAYRVTRRHAKEALLYLWERELRGGGYHMKTVRLRLPGRRAISAYTFVVDHRHKDYAGELSLRQTAKYIVQGSGDRGPCSHYLENTVEHLEELGLVDGPLHRLAEIVRRMAAAQRQSS
jgi:cation transport protein ChaC